MIGRNTRTDPTPPKMPSTTSDWATGFTSRASSPAPTWPASRAMPSSSQSDRRCPITEKVSQNTSAMMPIKAGRAV